MMKAMLDPGDAMTERALEQGRRNAEAIVLIKKHCAHARVEHSPHMGHSMLEEMTGLPISGREMRCEYGRPATTVGWDRAIASFRPLGSGARTSSPPGTTRSVGGVATTSAAVTASPRWSPRRLSTSSDATASATTIAIARSASTLTPQSQPNFARALK
jgi:hypothetical protein